MEAMLGETGEGGREEAGSSSCDKGGTCFNGDLNGDLEDAVEMCNVTQLNSSVVNSISNKFLNEDNSGIMDSLSHIASNHDSGADSEGSGEQAHKSEISDQVPSSQSANSCRVLDSEVPTVVGKNIESIDVGKTMGIQAAVSTNSVNKCEHSKDILDLNKNCDDSISHDYSIIEKSDVNECDAFSNEENTNCSKDDEKCMKGVTAKTIVFEVDSCLSEKPYDNCSDVSLIENFSTMENKVGSGNQNENDLEESGNECSDAIIKPDDLNVTPVKDNDPERGDNDRLESKFEKEFPKPDMSLSTNEDSICATDCPTSSSKSEGNEEKTEEQVQNQGENTETKSEETSSKGKKSRKSAVVLNLTPRRSSRNINKQKSYVEKEEEPEIQEIPPVDPLADPLSSDPLRDDKENSKSRGTRKNTIVVNDTKRLVEIASGSKTMKGGKKEPTLVIIDTNSILSGRGPVPVNQGATHSPSVVASSAGSSSGYSVLPIALPAQGLYPPMRGNNPVPTTSMHTPPTAPVPSRHSPPQILPTLTDDMYVVEAPSFIVPYVYEKPPIKPLKEFLEQLESEIEEFKSCKAVVNEEEKGTDSSPENGCSENGSKNQNEDCDSSKADNTSEKADEGNDEDNEEGPGDGSGGSNTGDGGGIDGSNGGSEQLKENGDESEVPASSSKADDESQSSDKDGDSSEVVSDSDNTGKSKFSSENRKEENSEKDLLSEEKQDTEKDVESEKGNESEKNEVLSADNNVNNPVDTKDKNEMKHEDNGKSSYFDNPLGKFFMQIGINLVQEYVQTDLLRSQKRKRDREGRKGQMSTQHAINSLVKNLEFSKENNEPFHLEQKKCEYCSFKTESSLVMAQHLETPHMRNYVYRCNFCPLEVRSPHDILFHMEAEHNVRGRLERAPAFHQCPNCPFEDSQKGKLTRHLLSCSKKHKPERNQEPPPDWEPPAKIPRLARSRPTALGLGAAAYQATMAAKNVHPLLPKLVPGSVLPPVPVGINRGRGRPPILRYAPQDPKAMPRPIQPTQVRQNVMYRPSGPPSQVLLPTAYQIAGSQIYQVVETESQMPAMPPLAMMSPSTALTTVPLSVALVPNVASGNNSIVVQSANKNPTAKLLQQPSISITPLPRQPAGMAPGSTVHPKHSGHSGGPGQPQNKATFVICEICDGYIKDLEQLRNHMQWIHKVKIHPKMIYNRPPLNCQKCQFRFFTDQGLERHLLGSHGLVTSSMQEAANKGKDGGRCPVCGRVYQWKLLNHVARDHNMSLKPAHLSYKCTVCTATFGMYKQFENHVYSAHSVVAKRVIDKKSPQVPRPQSSETLLKPLKINDEITIIPQPARPRPGPASRTGAVSAIMQQNMGPKRFKQRLQQKQSSVQVIELEDSPIKKDKAADGSAFQENGEDTLNAVKERLRRRKSLEISQVDSECSTLVSDDGHSKKRRRLDE